MLINKIITKLNLNSDTVNYKKYEIINIKNNIHYAKQI